MQITPRKLLFIGQDWGCEANLSALASDKDADVKSGTGKILNALLGEAKIPLEECFFTNALFGVREGKSNTGPSPGWSDQGFLQACTEAIKLQIEAVRPRGIICLGRDAPNLMARLIEECKKWTSEKSFKAIDAAGSAVMKVTSLPGIDVAAILLHPSFRRVNASHRSYGNLTGHEAELKILAETWTEAGRKSAS